jgi:fatty acid desaturase
MRAALLVVAALALLASASALSSPYKYLDRVHILVNTVGTFVVVHDCQHPTLFTRFCWLA